jgi:predicted RNA binding protein YcfA (HicA-like mRNA interferase family)
MSRKARKILEKMRRTKTGWRPRDFHTLYSGFGFIIKSGGRGGHTIYIHSKYRHIRDTIPQHSKELAPGYAKDAVKNIDLLLKLGKEEQENDR